MLDAAKELGYTGPNPLGRQLRSGRSGVVGVVVGDQLRRAFRDPVAVQVLDGLVSTLGENGLGVLLIPGIPSDDPARAVDPLVESAAMDVAVLVWGVGTDDATLAALQRRGVPVVVGEGRPVEGAPLVLIHDRAGTADAVRHLVELGHTRIAEVSLPLDTSDRSGPLDAARLAQVDRTPTANRLAGVRDVVEPVASWETEASLVEHGRSATLALLGRPAADGTTEPADPATRPTAVIAHSDLLAAGALLAARELGLRVPDDVSVAGFDGLDLPWLAPDVLTSVHQPLARRAPSSGWPSSVSSRARRPPRSSSTSSSWWGRRRAPPPPPERPRQPSRPGWSGFARAAASRYHDVAPTCWTWKYPNPNPESSRLDAATTPARSGSGAPPIV